MRRQGRGVRRQGHGVRRQSAASVRPCVAYAATRASRLRMGERTAAGGRVAIAVTRGGHAPSPHRLGGAVAAGRRSRTFFRFHTITLRYTYAVCASGTTQVGASHLNIEDLRFFCPIYCPILAGDAGNIQYPYLQGSKSIYLHLLTRV